MDLQFKMLGQRRRERVRRIALMHYERLSPSTDHACAIEAAGDQIRREFGMTGILAMFLVGIAVRLAAALIINWVQSENPHPPALYTVGEPGYSEPKDRK